ncbi:MAG: Sua5/YciO/YrdC/YwlC family protein, partial [Coriobacteriales bacterium]|nr:Sua5/YciO/YrdC/YwlC family protein [Coriobacteriales bacterium]
MADMNEIVDLAKPAFTAAMASLNEIVDLLKRGQVVVIPTDTVYGLALLVDESSDPNILYQIKGRPTEKSIPWLIGSFSDFLFYSESPPDWAVTLAKRHWPGALTLVCKASA